MKGIKGKTEKKYRTRDSGEYKSLSYFCIYDEKKSKVVRVTCFITIVHPLYSEETIKRIKKLNVVKVTKDVIPTDLGDYPRIIDGFSFKCRYPSKTSDIKEIEKKIMSEVEKILSEAIGDDYVIEACY